MLKAWNSRTKTMDKFRYMRLVEYESYGGPGSQGEDDLAEFQLSRLDLIDVNGNILDYPQRFVSKSKPHRRFDANRPIYTSYSVNDSDRERNANLFDHNVYNKVYIWFDINDCNFIQLDFLENVVYFKDIIGYQLWTGSDSKTYWTRNPNSWELQFSLDGTTWVCADKISEYKNVLPYSSINNYSLFYSGTIGKLKKSDFNAPLL